MVQSISIAMCTYNGAVYLRAQLESLAAQSRLPDELIVCDDNSSDETVNLVKSFASAAPFRVRLCVNDSRLGSTKNFEKAIGFCSGDLIALCDQDDIWLPHKLEKLAAQLSDTEDFGAVFSDAELIDSAGERLNRTLWEKLRLTTHEQVRLTRGEALHDLLRGSTVTGATMMFRSQYRNLALPIPDNPQLIHDGWIALIISCVAKISPVPEPLVLYREHSEQQVGARERNQPPGGVSAITAQQAHGAAMRENATAYRTTLATAKIALDRLTKLGDQYESRQARQALLALIAHFQRRATLPSSFWRRAPSVAAELATFRYWRFSEGLLSATKDLFYGGR